jgi:hypothetical protein
VAQQQLLQLHWGLHAELFALIFAARLVTRRLASAVIAANALQCTSTADLRAAVSHHMMPFPVS